MKYLNIAKAIESWRAIQPLSPRDRDRLSRKFTVDFNFNSNRIEGNTLTYGQTELLLLFGKVVGEKYYQPATVNVISAKEMNVTTDWGSVGRMTQYFVKVK